MKKLPWIAGIVIIAAIAWLYVADATEPQDVLIHGQTDADQFFIDGKLVGTGKYICVPKVKQWGTRTIEIRSGDTTVALHVDIGDLSIKILEPLEWRGSDVVELSNCQDRELIHSQTIFPTVEPSTRENDPFGGTIMPSVAPESN